MEYFQNQKLLVLKQASLAYLCYEFVFDFYSLKLFHFEISRITQNELKNHLNSKNYFHFLIVNHMFWEIFVVE